VFRSPTVVSVDALTNSALALWAVDLIARRFVAGDKRMLVLLLLMLLPIYQFHAQRSMPMRCWLATWPIATYCFLRSFETRRDPVAIAAGAVGAAGRCSGKILLGVPALQLRLCRDLSPATGGLMDLMGALGFDCRGIIGTGARTALAADVRRAAIRLCTGAAYRQGLCPFGDRSGLCSSSASLWCWRYRGDMGARWRRSASSKSRWISGR